MADGTVDQLRVLIHAPVGKDAQMIAAVLKRAHIHGEPCLNLEGIADELERGAGALILADDYLTRFSIESIAAWLRRQPTWSDLPILIMTSGGEADRSSIYRLRLVDPLGNVTLIERPLRKVTLVSSVRTAIRARKRQYEIRDHLEQLNRSEERLRDAILEAPIPIMIHTEEGEVLYISRAWTELSGYTQQDIPTLQAWAGKALSSEEPEDVSPDTRRAGGPYIKPGIELDITTKDGKARVWIFSAARLSPLLDGRRLLISAAMDITERKAMMDALRRANADLEQFAYAAAHDLQEPLRNLSLSTQLLAARYGGNLDAQADEFMKTTVESARRMHDLIQDLLAYTRAVEPSQDEPPADANRVMQGVIRNLKTAIEETGARVTYDPLPIVPIPEVQLMQVLQNLVGNALKYRGDKVPEVIVSAERSDKDWLFTVRDNGVGIAPQYHERIFKVFKRLHGRDIPGTGIGLAICQRIVGHYGGRTWVESKDGHGATFRFTLPLRRTV
ncbi:MAG TPA: ATP-binding protein [Bryobacteraceae bacterium]|nr:ATP-binding protein [Bryobacteraceae bacterium]